MGMATRIGAVTGVAMRGVTTRKLTSLVVVAGMAGAVAVVVAMLTIVTGVTRTTEASGRPDRAMVLSEGAAFEAASSIDEAAMQAVFNAEGIRRGEDDVLLILPEVLASAEVVPSPKDPPISIAVRGTAVGANAVRSEFRLLDGRWPADGVREVVAGDAVAREFVAARVGGYVAIDGKSWQVVGTFSSGDSHESEFLADRGTLAAELNRLSVSSVTAVLNAPSSFAEFGQSISKGSDGRLRALSEKAYYQQQAAAAAALLRAVLLIVAIIMAFGAVFSAINTMYAAVSARTKEIGTMRALGFGGGLVATSVAVEGVALSVFGGVLGVLVCTAVIEGRTASVGGAAGTTAFDMHVTWELMGAGVAAALLLGTLGAAAPALRAYRTTVIQALQGR